MPITWLDPATPDQPFPNPEKALLDPNGLLAIDGCLTPTRIINAYKNGIFPWYNPDEPILWWSPDPRLVLFPDEITISKSLRKTLRQEKFTIQFDRAFAEVVEACAGYRADAQGTWISEEIKNAYISLHHLGIAHSVEAWQDNQLVGGLYGLSLGRVFFGESMFHHQSDASKVAFVHLVRNLQRNNYAVIDCQVRTEHLMSLGAREISRQDFLSLLNQHCNVDNTWAI